MNNWYSTVYKAFIIAGVLSFILGFFVQQKTSLGAYMAGYSVLVLAILMILTVLFNKILINSGNETMYQTMYSILTITSPLILLVCVMTFVLYLLVSYQSNIFHGRTPSGYNLYSSIIVSLLLIQIFLVYKNLGNEVFETTGKLPKAISSVILFLGTVTTICSIMLYRILKYYSTDGFTILN
jgi:hypothetical protein